MFNASDSGSRGRRFEPHSGQTVLCPRARRISSPKVLVIPRKRWPRPNMTEKLFTGTLRINQPTNQPARPPVYLVSDVSIFFGMKTSKCWHHR